MEGHTVAHASCVVVRVVDVLVVQRRCPVLRVHRGLSDDFGNKCEHDFYFLETEVAC